MEISRLIEQFTQVLAEVDTAAADAYATNLVLLVHYVNQEMSQRPDIRHLLGPNPLDVMYDNHMNHAEFMLTQFRLQGATTLVHTLLWVFYSYTRRGFATDYFPTTLMTWMVAINHSLDACSAGRICQVYQLMLEQFPNLLRISRAAHPPSVVNESFREPFQQYLAAILTPDISAATRVAQTFIKTVWDIPVWYEEIILPAMYETGRMWAEGEIAVGQEHIATAITQRIMSMYYPMILELPRDKGMVLVTASPEELHEIGARMVADILEMYGWDVYYTGADTPEESLLDLLQQHPVEIVCISTTLTFSLQRTANLIARIRAANLNHPVHIIVGGQAYLTDPGLAKQVGADGFAASATDLVRYLQNYHQ